jgi:Flp pilus assembly pilin Flp
MTTTETHEDIESSTSPEDHKERGASLVEYALLVGLIAVVCIGALTFFGESTGSLIDSSGQSIFPG